MSTVYTTSLTTAHHLSSPLTPGVKLVHHLNGYTQPMDGRQPKYEAEYPQSGLNSSYPTFPEPDSEGSSADQASAAQYTPGQDPRTSNFSSSATPTSEYGLAPSSARSGSFPDYIQRGYHPSSGQTTPAGGMAQATSPSSPLHNGAANNSGHSSGSNSDLPLDPSIAAASPTYTPHQPPYSPYGPPSHENPQHYQQHSNIYARPDWAISQPYPPAHPHMPHYGHATSGAPAPAMVSPVARPPTVGTLARITMYSAPQSDANYSQGGHPMSTVYSFVPIPGAQQHKRPRRRYEEIERMYKCGWNGCEKAYGTLNHLNAHVTMQSHGTKRTPEEFKEIRKEWKQKKKEDEAARKADDERVRQEQQRAAQGAENGAESQVYGHMRAPAPAPGNPPQLPPIGYAPAAGAQAPVQYASHSPGLDGAGRYAAAPQQQLSNGNNQIRSYPQSPYGQGHPMYQQQPDNSPSSYQQ